MWTKCNCYPHLMTEVPIYYAFQLPSMQYIQNPILSNCLYYGLGQAYPARKLGRITSLIFPLLIFSPHPHFSFFPPLETLEISIRLDFLKCVQIFLSSKTQICRENVYRFSRWSAQICTVTQDTLQVQICVLEEVKIWTHLRKSKRTEVEEGFRLRNVNLLTVNCGRQLLKFTRETGLIAADPQGGGNF